MFQPSYGNSYNGSQYNFTEPFNSTIGDVENTNASRHFADQPQSEGFTHLFLFYISIKLCNKVDWTEKYVCCMNNMKKKQ